MSGEMNNNLNRGSLQAALNNMSVVHLACLVSKLDNQPFQFLTCLSKEKGWYLHYVGIQFQEASYKKITGCPFRNAV